MKILLFLKKQWKYVLTALISIMIGAAIGPSSEEFEQANAKAETLKKQFSEKEQVVVKLKSENEDLQTKIDEAAPWFKLSEEEKKQQEAEAKAAEEKRLAEEKAKAEAEAKAAEEKRLAEEKAKADAEAKAKAEAEAEEKKGYETGITFNQLARTPDDYIGKKVKFHGKVIQVIEGDGMTQIRFAVNENYDTVLFAQFDASVVSSRVLEDDVITIMGLSTGLITYDSTLGGQISIPGVAIDKIEQ